MKPSNGQVGSIIYRALKHVAQKTLPESWFNSLGWQVGALRARGYWAALKKMHLEPPHLVKFTPGVNLVGYFEAPSGMGESVRLLAAAVKIAAEPLAAVTVQPPPGPALSQALAPSPYDINIIHINPPELPFIFPELGRGFWHRHYNIGFWLWELENFPQKWQPAFNLFDELWAPSEFISRCLRKSTGLPVITMPYGLSVDCDPACDRDFFKLPTDKFLFLVAADGLSILERKNPLGAVRAYARAFGPRDEGVGLVIKVRNASDSFIKQIQSILNGYPNIFYITEDMEKRRVNSLIKNVNVFVSLHRAEGFGLVLAEAMLLGTPCLATNWSANTEFMNQETSGLVDWRPTKIKHTIGPYRQGQSWAEPDLDQAAAYMKRLYLDEDYRLGLAAKAQLHLRQILSPENMARKIKDRLSQIRSSCRPLENRP